MIFLSEILVKSLVKLNLFMKVSILLTLYFLVSAADNFWKQFGPRSGLAKPQPVFFCRF